MFHSRASAHNVHGIEFVAFHSDVAKDASYSWRLRHESNVVPLILASLPFHNCDEADTSWLRQTFTDDFGLQRNALAGYIGYRGDNAHRDTEYFLAAPDGRESFYLYIDF